MDLKDKYLDRIADALEEQMGVSPKLIGGNVLKPNIDRIADALDPSPILLKDGTIKNPLARIADSIEGGNFGGSGSPNILFGTDNPVSSVGSDRSLYFQYKTLYASEYEDSGLGWYAKKEYVVKDTTTDLWKGWTKKSTVPSIAVLCHTNGYYGPIQVSTNPDGVTHNNNMSPKGSKTIDGVTWYQSTDTYWDRNELTHDIPLFEARSTDPSILIPLILSEADTRLGTIKYETFDIITHAYLKTNGTWQPLIGSDLKELIDI